jgi:hypothetical protein
MGASRSTVAVIFVSLLAVVPLTLVLRVVPRMRSRDSSLLGLHDELPYRSQVDADARLTYVGDQKPVTQMLIWFTALSLSMDWGPTRLQLGRRRMAAPESIG